MSNEVVSQRAAMSLRFVSWAVLLVGAIFGAWALYLGFTAVEPWTSDSQLFGGFTVTEEWQSIALGFLAAAYIAVVTGFVWSLTLLGRAVANYLGKRGS